MFTIIVLTSVYFHRKFALLTSDFAVELCHNVSAHLHP